MLCSGRNCVIFISLSFGGDQLERQQKWGNRDVFAKNGVLRVEMECVRVGEYISNEKQLSWYFLTVDNM
jgi:hypothetical protein